MNTNIYHLIFRGYWLSTAIDSIPAESGIYCVYACETNANSRNLALKELVYIGESENVRNRIERHENWPVWECRLDSKYALCFSFASVPDSSRVRLEAACIHEHKPPVNFEFVETFPYDRTSVDISGETGLLRSRFTVEPKGTNYRGTRLW